MSATTEKLEALCADQPKFLKKGGLCVGLVITQRAKENGLPIEPESLRTGEGGQVAGLGKAAVQKILETHGITKVLAEEGGRTSRGSLGLMRGYINLLNALFQAGMLDIQEAELWWITKVRIHFAATGPKFHFDSGKSIVANVQDLLDQADELQMNSGGTNYVGAMLQHLVGAKLDLVLGEGKVHHHGFSVADQSTERKADFQIDSVAIHVTTNPSEALIRKCGENLSSGLKPVIVTLGEGVHGAAYLLQNAGLQERVDVLDCSQLLTANLYERSLFQASECKISLTTLLQRYNQIVSLCERDPGILVSFE